MDERGPLEPLPGRAEAGRRLGLALAHLRPSRPVVLGLPRGGVPVADPIARSLRAPLDVLVVRKIGAPGNPEYGLGAVVEGGGVYLDRPRLQEVGVTEAELGPSIRAERERAEREATRYRAGRPRVGIEGRVVVVVDDGVATGGSAIAAVRSLRAEGARRIVVALGVGPPDAIARLGREAEEVVVLLAPPAFYAVGQWYDDFAPVPERTVVRLLETPPERD